MKVAALARDTRTYCVLVVVALVLATVGYQSRDAIIVYTWHATHVPVVALQSDDPAFLMEAGTYHLDSRSARAYDIDAAEKLVRKAVLADATVKYGFFQLARIAFLRGDYGAALVYINLEIEKTGGVQANVFYIRGLIQGFAGDYDAAVDDYKTYLASDPTNWAAINDYAWVLLKADRPSDALRAIEKGLSYWPGNPWLLSNKATALYELGHVEEAYAAALLAREGVTMVDEEAWRVAYPGNDPLIAREGIAAFTNAIEENIHTIGVARENASKPMQ